MSYPSSPQESGATAGAPGYPPNPYPPPAQPAPGFPPPAPPTLAPPTLGQPPIPPPGPPRKSNAGKIILIVVAAAVLLCGGGVAVAAVLLKNTVDEVVEATQIRLVVPETLAGMPKNDSAELQPLADALSSELKTNVPEATGTVGAFYGDLKKQELLMLAGVSGLIPSPEAEVAAAVDSSGAEMSLRNVRTVDAGPQGGSASCADGEAEEIKVGFCVWASRGSLVMFVLYFSTGEKAAAELVGIRAAVEQKK